MLLQEYIALGIVGATAVLFLLRAFQKKRRGKKNFHQATGCGCSTSFNKTTSIVIQGKRGESPMICLKTK